MITPLAKVARSHQRAITDREAERQWFAVCRLVEVRDGFVCRACQRKVVKTMRVQVDRLEHHHVIPKSHGGPDEVWNVAVICKGCHDERHVTRELHITGRADQALTFEQDGKVWTS